MDLNAWVEYEFRVLARNTVGVGEPSPVSVRTRTEDAGRAGMLLPPAERLRCGAVNVLSVVQSPTQRPVMSAEEAGADLNWSSLGR